MQNSNAKLSLTSRIFIGMIAGILIGFTLQLGNYLNGDLDFQVFSITFSTYGFFVEGIFHAGGKIFINALKMLVVPLVFVSLVCGTSSLSDPSKLGKLGGKSIALYMFTTFVAVTFAMTSALLFKPGAGFQAPSDTPEYVVKEAPSLVQVIIDMVPSNPISSMAEGQMIPIIVFAILFGISMSYAGEAGKRLSGFFNDLNEVIMKIVTIVMNFAPYGVFCLIAKLSATIEWEDIFAIGAYFFNVLIILILHAIIVYPLLLKLTTGLNPLILLSKLKEVAAFAFSSASSSATLPLTIATARQKLGVSRSVSSFTLPLGATINMDGTAIMQGIATVFIAQAYQVDLSTVDLLMVVLTATLASVGAAGVPGVGLILLAVVLQQVNLPVEGIALIIGIDRLLDMTRTVVNVTGDSTIATIVAKTEGELDEDIYHDRALAKQKSVVE
ncbi:dicarboxylate/amino acid:cation symporter [Brumicola blandensis]|jgi:Na+/H+-dicarboxylate symporter|uniref:Dicarboxylate/amino acid:cation symporter n=1 Tax=Brumicola blandensis TaxID=3075611 RepID=A0AAW8QXJ1_9ALTE|nr:dicarboxylate/amino acid:cation symporter [Alteromonas sp. W409]MDT0581345.1 dicarboxylate/amino acid:cation symporter [Alteromonas sp. W409]